MVTESSYQELKERIEKLEALLGEKVSDEKRILINQQRLNSLWKISSLVKKGFKEICETLLDEIVVMTESQYGFFGFINNNEDEMIVYSWSKTVMNDCAIDIKPLIFPIEESGIWGNAIRERKPVIFNDYGTELANKRGAPEGHVAIKRILSVPVFSISGKVVALGCVANKEEDYNDADKNQLVTYLNNVQLILENRKTEEDRKHFLEESLSESLKELVRKETELNQTNKELLKEIAIRKETEKELRKIQEALRLQAITDSLTGLYNRGHFYKLAEIEISKSLRYSRPLSVMMYDIDFFKRINDKFGHLVGDMVLKMIAEVTKKELRTIDIPARYGGEEFIALLPETSVSGAAVIAERLRKQIENTTVETEDHRISVTVSFGISNYLRKSSSEPFEMILTEFISGADQALYASKNAGRNRVTVFDPKET